MELGLLHAVLALALIVGLAVFARAFLGGSRMLGGFWDRERAQRADTVARAQRESDTPS
jgi:hypothetical protein